MELPTKQLDSESTLPCYSREGDAGLDLKSIEDKNLSPNKRAIIKTGIAVAIPKGFVGLIWDRSGLAAKSGLHTLAGVIDSNYRGEIGVVIINLSKENYQIKKGDKIAQMIIQPVATVKIKKVEELDETKRNGKGFGSTGR